MKRHLRAGLFCAAVCNATALAQAASVTFCSDGAPEGFDIAQYETVITNDAAGLTLYDTLLQFKPGTTELEPGLAERHEVSADGLTYTLHLRRGVKFHTTPWFKPTRDFNADDVLWSLNRINDKSHPAHGVAKNGYPYWAGMEMNTLVKAVTKVDAYTVRIALNRPEAALASNLAMNALASVYSAEYAEQLQKAGKPEQINTQPIGTGPFVFKSYQKDAVIRYTANAAYWGGAPKVDLIFAITPDPAVRIQRLKAGECQVAVLAGDKAMAFDGDAQVAVLRSQPLTTTYIATNHRHRFLSDKRFREALSIAIDRASIVQSVYGGNAVPAGSFLPPGIWSYDAQIKTVQNVERARQLVKASGYDGSELTLFATARSGDVKRAVELLQADWAKVGVKVRPELMELGELYKRTGKGEHDLALLSWYSDNGDPDNFLTPNLSCAAAEGGGNKSQWCHKGFDALLAAGRATPDRARRTETYRQAQALLFAETGLITVANRQQLHAVNKRVKGFLATPFGGSDFRSVTVSP
ncbi:ABC transporter substrate-binding protein [Sphaerotilaceae bacterium SBD11-9]